jgi:hypothetical protein
VILSLAAVLGLGERELELDAAGNTLVLVELFTSQGCEGCPGADNVLTELHKDQPIPGVQIVPLSLHVDYWDSQGWRDQFSSATFSERQLAYVRELGLRQVYTPQVMVGGAVEARGADRQNVIDAIRAVAFSRFGENDRVKFDLALKDGNMVQIRAQSVRAGRSRQTADVYYVLVQKRATQSVSAGENAGKVLSFTNVAREFQKLGELTLSRNSVLYRQTPVRLPNDMNHQNASIIAFAQDKETLRVIGVSMLELN